MAGAATSADEDGSTLWLRYTPVEDKRLVQHYRRVFTHVVGQGSGPVFESARAELSRGVLGMLGKAAPWTDDDPGGVVIGVAAESPGVLQVVSAAELAAVGEDGYIIRTGDRGIRLAIAANTAKGVLYGVFHLLRLLQTRQRLERLNIVEKPANSLRLHNHWDNITDSVERGYSGSSIFEWSVPGLSPRVPHYGRALASIGLDRTVVNNVNANPNFLTPAMLQEVKLVADALRPWGVRLMLSANFASPKVLGKLPTADPLNAAVGAWWRDKAAEIYALIPDFGGFLVKANSEGQPGPTDYGRSHADGANVIAAAVAPHGGICIWRAFVYEFDGDVTNDAYNTFKPLDGKFADNAVIQAKYGPIDFHVREAVHPLFGAMPRTNMTLELQITQEHTGHATHLCSFAPWWSQVLAHDTHAKGTGPTVAQVIDGSGFGRPLGGMSGVSNYGSDPNWTGHHLHQANSYTFGRLAWNPRLDPDEVLREWIHMTFSTVPGLTGPLHDMLATSWKTFEDYTSPLGSGNLVAAAGGHYDPHPAESGIADATSIGNSRTVATGIGFTGLYHEPWASTYENLATCPDELILFMHRVPYGHRLHSGKTVLQHIYDTHFEGRDRVDAYRTTWAALAAWVDARRHREVATRFDAQYAHATVWRDTIVGYLFKLSRLVDERRRWVQYEMANPGASLLFGGWPNSVDVTVGNASTAPVDITARLTAPEDWSTQTATATVEATEFESVSLGVTPPPVGTLTPATVAVSTPDGRPVLGSAALDLVVTPGAARCVLALDAGTSTSPLVKGYQRLSVAETWDPARGYGWVDAAPAIRDRGASLDPLRRDFVGYPGPRTLRIAVPAGRYPAYALVGDVIGSQPTAIAMDGVEVARSRFLQGNQFQWLSFTVDGGATGRTIDLELSSVPGEWWHLNALAVVDPDSVLPELLLLDVQPTSLALPLGVPARLKVSLRNTTDRALTPAPVATVTEGYSAVVAPASAEIPAHGTAEFSVDVTRTGTAPGTLTVAVGDQQQTVALAPVESLVRAATMSASSTHPSSSPALANDGVTDSERWANGAGGWNDGTAGVFPDELTADWTLPVSIGRVVVHTLNSRSYPASAYGLRDYDVEAHVDGTWRPVAQVRGNVAGVVTSSFAPVTADRLRLRILDTNDHRHSRVIELEAFPA